MFLVFSAVIEDYDYKLKNEVRITAKLKSFSLADTEQRAGTVSVSERSGGGEDVVITTH